jgi:hypothetical protein
VGPRDVLQAVSKRKKSRNFTCWELNPGRPAGRIVTILTELPRFFIRLYTVSEF